jgi:hypothetical protein
MAVSLLPPSHGNTFPRPAHHARTVGTGVMRPAAQGAGFGHRFCLALVDVYADGPQGGGARGCAVAVCARLVS